MTVRWLWDDYEMTVRCLWDVCEISVIFLWDDWEVIKGWLYDFKSSQDEALFILFKKKTLSHFINQIKKLL